MTETQLRDRLLDCILPEDVEESDENEEDPKESSSILTSSKSEATVEQYSWASSIPLRKRVELGLGLKIDDHVDNKIDQLQYVLTRIGDENCKQLRLLRHNVLSEVTQEAKLIGHLLCNFK